MQGPAQELRRGGRLHDLPQIHHRDPVADRLHRREVVADEDVGRAQLVLQLHQQVQDLGLQRDVQRGHGFVMHDQRRLRDKRPGDGRTLLLPAR